MAPCLIGRRELLCCPPALATQDLVFRSLNTTKEDLAREQKARQELEAQSEMASAIYCTPRQRVELGEGGLTRCGCWPLWKGILGV